MNRLKTLIAFAAVLVAALSISPLGARPASAADAPNPQFTTISYPSIYPTQPTVAAGINGRGDIVGHYVGNDFHAHGFVLSGGEFTSFDYPGGTSAVMGTEALGINDRKDIVGWYQDASPPYKVHGFLRSRGVYTTLDFPGATNTSPYGISSRGQIVGSFLEGERGHGFLYSSGTWTRIDHPDAPKSTILQGINARGDIVGYSSGFASDPSLVFRAFLLHDGVFTMLDADMALGISDADDIVGARNSFLGQRFHGFLLSGGVYTDFDHPDTIDSTYASGVNSRGDIVGWFDNIYLSNSGFLLAR